MRMDVRAAAASELDHLARLWHDIWYETHAHLMPPALLRLRTLENFRDRVQAALALLRVVGRLVEQFIDATDRLTSLLEVD